MPSAADTRDAAHLEHLDEGDGEVEVDRVAEVQGEGHEEAYRHDAQHVEPHRHLALDLHHLQDLQQITAKCTQGFSADSVVGRSAC